ncbi:MAG: hypothetical protein LBQ40_03040, partial [Clostridiales bacterium]|nr:hypothetical protein [Clostridiales bacterium]
MVIYVFSAENYLLRLDGREICKDGAAHELRRDGVFIFEALSFMPRGARFYPSFAAKLEIADGRVKYASDCFVLTDFGGGNYEARLRPYAVYDGVTSNKTAEASFETGYKSYRAEVRETFFKYLKIAEEYPEGGREFSEPLPDGLCGETLSVIDGGYKKTVVLNGTADGQKYMLLTEIGQGSADAIAETVFECLADAIEIEKDADGGIRRITTAKSFNDMLKRTRTEVAEKRDGSYVRVSGGFSYAKRSDEYPTELLPYLFAEAVGAGDAELIAEYLSKELLQNADDVFGYFGDFFAVDYPKYSDAPLNVLAFKYANGNAIKIKYFEFEQRDGKIVNFNLIN